MSHEVSFEDAVFKGLAPDGGLYVPTSTPDLGQLFRSFGPDTTFGEIAERMIQALLPELDGPRGLAERAFPFSPKIVTPDHSSNPDIRILELFHGPSCAFKDFGASFLATVMERFLTARGGRAVILTATSGDTGSAVAQAFHGRENVDVVVLYPSGRVSPLQEKQLTTLGGNVVAAEVLGSFDDCQRMVKEAFVDPSLNRDIVLSSANSINLGRLLPQSFYYVWACAQLREEPSVAFCVPSGNFGNLTAGVLAWRWGLPVAHFIAATNRNDVVPSYLRTGVFTPRVSVATYSNAMDVGNPSNFERLLFLFDNDRHAMSACIHEEVVTDQETVDTIAAVYRATGMLLDPHTAVGYLAAQRTFAAAGADLTANTIISLATAHPGKFQEIVEPATGARPTLPQALQRLVDLPKHSVVIDGTLSSLAKLLRDRYA